MYESVDVVTHKSRAPSLLYFAAEASRAMMEGATLGSVWPWLRPEATGDGHPVMLLPGFLGGDASTAICRQYLRRSGYNALPWQLGTNTGRESLQNDLLKRFLRLRHHYRQPISLVGHSLGGVFARELARQFPDDVRCVVTLGSPFGVMDVSAVSQVVRMVFEQVSGESVEEKRQSLLHTDPGSPTGVPSTAIYSRSDGVVHWQSCIEEESELTENIEVYSSHCGMVINASVLAALTNRLAQPLGGWRKFDTTRLSRRLCYPKQRKSSA